MAGLKIVGIGSGASNVIGRMAWLDEDCHEFLLINAEGNFLEKFPKVPQVLLNGVRRGTYGNPNIGRVGVSKTIPEIREKLQGVEKVLLVSALGGGTGSGVVPVVARIAREMGIKTAAFVTLPFPSEGALRKLQSEDSVGALRSNIEDVIVLPLEQIEKPGFSPAYSVHVFGLIDERIRQEIQRVTKRL